MACTIKLDEIENDDILARDIDGSFGGIVLVSGSKLKKAYISTLKDLGVDTIDVIRDVNNSITEGMQKEIKKDIKNQLDMVSQKLYIDAGLKSSVLSYIYSLIDVANIYEDILEIKRNDRYTYGHSLNVGIITNILCVELNMSDVDTYNIVIGALMHDIGKILTPKQILNKCGRLDDIEMEVMRSHSNVGYTMIQSDKRFSPSTKMVVLSHHEREDGSGYPSKLMDSIDLGAKIVAVADVFDALVSDRPYRSGMSMNKAVEIMNKDSLDIDVKDILFSLVVYYPEGSVVTLSNGCIGVVEGKSRDLKKPTMRLIYDMVNGDRLDDLFTLSDAIDVFIVDRIDNKQNIDKVPHA